MADFAVIFDAPPDEPDVAPPWWWRGIRWPLCSCKRHCWTAQSVGGGYWLGMDAGTHGLDLRAMAPDEMQAVIDHPRSTVLLVNRFEARPHPRGVATCVVLAKLALGLRAWWVQTPNQLYRALIRRGATEARTSCG